MEKEGRKGEEKRRNWRGEVLPQDSHNLASCISPLLNNAHTHLAIHTLQYTPCTHTLHTHTPFSSLMKLSSILPFTGWETEALRGK